MFEKIDIKIFGLSVLLSTLFCGGIWQQYEYKKDINQMSSELTASAKLINDMKNELDVVKKEKNKSDDMIVELNSHIEKLEYEIKNANIKINEYKETITKLKNNDTKITGKTLRVEATAYANDPITATGVKPTVGRTIAVDPKVIPLGSKVKIEGMGTFIAEDTGGVIKGNKIDIFMATESECRNWGRRKVNIQIL